MTENYNTGSSSSLKWIPIVLVIGAIVIGLGFYFYLIQKNKTTYEAGSVRQNSVQQSNTPRDSAESENVVQMNNYVFFPDTITVKVGDSVTWRNMDNTSHSATADDKLFDTGVFDQGGSETVAFDEPGTYTYHCSLHPSMKGTIIVE